MKIKACSVEPDFATCGSCVSLLLSFHTEKKVSNYFLQRKKDRTLYPILIRLFILNSEALALEINAHRAINSTKWKLTPSKRLGNSRPQGQLTLLRRRKIVFFLRRPFVRTHIFAVVGDGFAVVVVPRVATAVFYVKVKAGAFYVYYVGYAVGLQGKT